MSKPRVVGLVQMRMGSTRLPGKMLKPLAGEDVAGLVVGRMRRARLLDQLVVATTVSPGDDPLAARCGELGVPVFRGDEEDVLDRFFQAAQTFGGQAVVRLTGDCPLHDPAVIDLVVQAFLEGQGRSAYVSNCHPPTFPDGLDVEVFSFAALAQAWAEASRPSDREHVTPFIVRDEARFPRLNVVHAEDLSRWRWTLDEPQDHLFLTEVLARLNGSLWDFGLADVLRVLEACPELSAINGQFHRNEGYARSLAKERKSREA